MGVEIAQREAIIIPNMLDHYVQNKTSLIRFMDDSIILVKNYNEGKNILNEYKKIAGLLHIKINSKKSFISQINKTFKYCKWRYKLLNNGKLICIPCIETIRRQRLKLKKMKKINLSKEEIQVTKTSFKAYLSLGNTERYQQKL